MPQLDRLGLRENPFKKTADQRYFYADQNRAQILESTEHLIDYSSNFQVIIGESGVGKSHFLETLASRVDNNWRVAKVNNGEQYDTLSLIQAILDAFGAIDGGHSELLEALETQLAEINQLGFKPVLLVDNAQALSIDSLRFLIQLSQQKQNEEPYINIILFASDEITESLQRPELRPFREIIHIATLSRFDKEGVSGYLRHKMAVAGYDRESPFTPRIIDSIFSNSEGLPEKINFFADKFLASSGKAENYIDPSINHQKSKADSAAFGHNFEADNSLESNDSLDPNTSPESGTDNAIDEFSLNLEQDSSYQADNENLLDSLKNEELQVDRSDRASEQISRLAEKFEEIEQLGEQPADSFFSDSDQDSIDQGINDLTDDEQTENYFSDETSSVLPKFIIPIAVIGILLVAVIVINSVFDKSQQTDSQQADKEKIELLPLELPPQGSVLIQEESVQQPDIENTQESSQLKDQEQKSPETAIDTSVDVKNIKKEMTSQEPVPDLEVLEADDSNVDRKALPPSKAQDVTDKEMVSQESVVKKPVSIPEPGLTKVEPEPVIGSNSRQHITIMGNNLEKDTSLVVTWANNKKEFSAKQTPEQWQYVNKNKIKLHLSTGIESQQWQVAAKSANGSQSQNVSFDVVRPFISKMAIQSISPDPFVGSDKRQAVTIMGQGFSKQTVLELKWDKNKKHFSSRLTPSQFEYISANQIKLFIATGTKERKWRVLATNPTGNTSASSFTVVKDKMSANNKPEDKVEKNNAAKASVTASSGSILKDERWLRQQPDTNYTIQLFGSYNKQAIDELVKKHSLKGDILRFETQRDGKSWFTMTYGNYLSKQDASAAVTSLDPALIKSTPWLRSMGSIKESLGSSEGQPGEVISTDISSKVKDESWIWTQNPADYTVQLIALSSEKGIKDYISEYKIQSEAVYFKTIRNGNALYVLLYGKYANKQLATQAGEKLSTQIKGIKPWVRSFSTVHGMMSSR